jgi:hypothetical protein
MIERFIIKHLGIPIPYPRRVTPRLWLYHVTKVTNLDSILAIGLTPHAGRFMDNEWPPAVYFVTQARNADLMIRTFEADALRRLDNRFDPTGMVVLKIKPDPHAVYWRDGACPFGRVTTSPVPPQGIVSHSLWRRSRP